jgi:hypothetical protein
MKTKTNKGPKSPRSKFSDLSPKKDARGGRRAHNAARQGLAVNNPDVVPPSNPNFPPHLPV